MRICMLLTNNYFNIGANLKAIYKKNSKMEKQYLQNDLKNSVQTNVC